MEFHARIDSISPDPLGDETTAALLTGATEIPLADKRDVAGRTSAGQEEGREGGRHDVRRNLVTCSLRDEREHDREHDLSRQRQAIPGSCHRRHLSTPPMIGSRLALIAIQSAIDAAAQVARDPLALGDDFDRLHPKMQWRFGLSSRSRDSGAASGAVFSALGTRRDSRR